MRRKETRPIQPTQPTLQSIPTHGEATKKKNTQDIPLSVLSPRRRVEEKKKNPGQKSLRCGCGDARLASNVHQASFPVPGRCFFPAEKKHTIQWVGRRHLPYLYGNKSIGSLVGSDLLPLPSLLLRSSLSRCSHQRGQGRQINA